MTKTLKAETKPMKYLRLYRWLKLQGYQPKIARASAQLKIGYCFPRNYWEYWKHR